MGGKKATPFNDYSFGKGDGDVRSKTASVDARTRAALRELASICTWAEFVHVCEEQRRKRGW